MGLTNKQILGMAGEEAQAKSVSVQKPDGTFVKMTPLEAKAYLEGLTKVDPLTLALQRFQQRKKQIEEEQQLLSLGGSDPRGKETLRKIMSNMGRRTLR